MKRHYEPRPPRWTDLDRQKLVEMTNRGVRPEVIARLLGYSLPGVQAMQERMRDAINVEKLQSATEPARAVLPMISPVDAINIRDGQCRHIVARRLFCGKPALFDDRCPEHAHQNVLEHKGATA